MGRSRTYYELRNGTRIYPVELAATGLFLALCVDAKTSSVKRNSGSKKWRLEVPVYWKVDVPSLVTTLTKHGIIDKFDAYSDNTFYLVRNGYIQLRKRKLNH
jgi:hypothetical protein